MSKNKGRPAQVTRQEIIDCALNMGLNQVSMHAIGKQLGVSATALYRHVNSKEELIAYCYDHIVEQVKLPEENNWEACLHSFANNFRQVLLSTPHSVEFIRFYQEWTPAAQILANDILGVLRQAHFDAQVGFMAFATVFTRVTDIVQHQEQAQNKLHNTEHPNTKHFKAKQLPHLEWLLNTAPEVDYDQYFHDGIKISIEGIKAVYNREND